MLNEMQNGYITICSIHNICNKYNKKTKQLQTVVDTQCLQLLFLTIPSKERENLFFRLLALAAENQVHNDTENQCTSNCGDGNLAKA